MQWPEFKERFARLREAVTLIRQLWREERVTFEGEYYRTENATIYDRPDEPVPIYVAAAGAAGRATTPAAPATASSAPAARAPELYTETLLPKVAEGLAAAVRPRPFDRMIEMKVSFDTDRARAMEDTRHWAALALTRGGEDVGRGSAWRWRRSPTRCRSSARRAAGSSPTDPDEHVEQIRTYVELGFRHLVFHAPGRDQERFLRLYGEQVLPRLRALLGER